jgi:hypothetical protein
MKEIFYTITTTIEVGDAQIVVETRPVDVDTQTVWYTSSYDNEERSIRSYREDEALAMHSVAVTRALQWARQEDARLVAAEEANRKATEENTRRAEADYIARYGYNYEGDSPSASQEEAP